MAFDIMPSRPLSSLLFRKENPFYPVILAGETIGWFALTRDDEAEPSLIHVAQESMVYTTGRLTLTTEMRHTSNSQVLSFSHNPVTQKALKFQAEIILNIPDGAIQLQEDRPFNGHFTKVVDFNEGTAVNLMAALHNFWLHMKHTIQQRFNSMNIKEAAECLTQLVQASYPHVSELTWRGQNLNSLTNKSKTVVFYESAQEKDIIGQFSLTESSRLADFMKYLNNRNWRQQPKTKRVFHYVAKSKRESEWVQSLAKKAGFFSLLKDIHSEEHNAKPFLCISLQNDPLKNWIVGTRVSKKQMLAMEHFLDVQLRWGAFNM